MGARSFAAAAAPDVDAPAKNRDDVMGVVATPWDASGFVAFGVPSLCLDAKVVYAKCSVCQSCQCKNGLIFDRMFFDRYLR